MDNEDIPSEDIPTVTYFLVLLHAGPDRVTAEPPWSAHVEFIDTLTELDVVLLGGDLSSPVAGAEAAYLLHTSTRHEAEAWAQKDPLILHRYYVPEVVEWHLVGINLGAIDPALRLPKSRHQPNTASKEHRSMSESNLVSVVGVLPVTDHADAVTWYQRWIGRGPDVKPMEGVAEWQLAENAWIQVSVDPESAGRATVVVGVADIDTHRSACAAADVAISDVSDYGVVKTAEAVDPAGNRILFVQEVPQG